MSSEPQFALNRREFLGAAVAAPAIAAVDDERPLIIDCHAHIYGEPSDETAYPPIDEPYRPPAGRGTVGHLREEMQRNGVRFVTAVQTSTYYRWDNRFTVEAAKKHSEWMVGICTMNPDDPQSPSLLEFYTKERNVRGMRSIPGADGRLDSPGVDRLWSMAERLGIVINVLVGHELRPQVEALVQKHPKLRVVIDHCFSLKAGPDLQPALADCLALAKYPNVHAKLTFIPTGSAEDAPCRDMHDACRRTIDAFGSERCVWGSDFPCELWCPKVSYGQHLDIFQTKLGLSAADRKNILGATAFNLWFKPLGS